MGLYNRIVELSTILKKIIKKARFVRKPCLIISVFSLHNANHSKCGKHHKSVEDQQIPGKDCVPKIWPRTPKRGDIRRNPTYPPDICTPITDCEYSAPKLSGVRWLRLGNSGALPTPIRKSPAAETDVPKGRARIMIAINVSA